MAHSAHVTFRRPVTRSVPRARVRFPRIPLDVVAFGLAVGVATLTALAPEWMRAHLWWFFPLPLFASGVFVHYLYSHRPRSRQARVLKELPPAVRMAVLTCAVILISGTSFSYALLWNFTDAVQFTVQTLTTTGYGSLDPSAWTPALKWFSIPW